MPQVETMLDRVMRLHALGLTVIPLKEKGKEPDGSVLPRNEQGKPVWEPFQFQPPTLDDYRRWFGNGVARNAGVLTGPDVVVVESDTAEAEAWCASNLPPTPMVTRSARGLHRYYRYPSDQLQALLDQMGMENLPEIPAELRPTPEVRIEVKRHGQYVVAPGSVHPGKESEGIPPGHVYAEVAPWPSSLADVPELPLSIIPAAPKSKTTKPTAAPLPAFIDSMRNVTLTREAGKLRRLGWDEDEIAAALLTLNETRCQPPLPEQEVRAIAHSVGRYAAGQFRHPDTESGDAAFFAELYGNEVRYDHRAERWLVLDAASGIWLPDTVGVVFQLALTAIRERQRIATEINDSDERKRALKWAIQGESRGRLGNLLALAKTCKPIADAGDGWDQITYLLGTPNGVVDLRTGEHRRAKPEERVTMRTSVPYVPGAISERWERTLTDIFPDAQERSYLQTALGYTTTGEMNLDKWFLPNGPQGRNGKGTVLGAVRAALGDYAIEVDAATFDRKKDSTPFNLAKLPGKRFAHCAEAGDSTTLHHDRLKQISGGDPIMAGDKNQRAFEFRPTCKLWFSCNTRPKVSDESAAFWARVVVILFAQTFAGKEDTSIRDALRHEPEHQQAILTWLVEGARRYYAQRGLGEMPAVFKAATGEFQMENDRLADFYAACCVTGAGVKTKASDLWKAYGSWAEGEHVRFPLGSKSFYQQVASRYRKVEGKDGNWYLGIGLREDRAQESGGDGMDAMPFLEMGRGM